MLAAGHDFLEEVVLLHKSSNFRKVTSANFLCITRNIACEVAALHLKKSVRQYIQQARLSRSTGAHDGYKLSGFYVAAALAQNLLHNLAAVFVSNNILHFIIYFFLYFFRWLLFVFVIFLAIFGVILLLQLLLFFFFTELFDFVRFRRYIIIDIVPLEVDLLIEGQGFFAE